MSELQGLFFWGFLLVFGVAMYLVVPKSEDEAGFFRGHDSEGRPASEWALMMSIFISWIFAKSVTNAANLGANERAALGLSGEAGSPAEALAKAGMKEMSDKFNAMGQQVYVDADKVKAPHTTALDSEAAHAAKNAAWVKESNKAL